MPIPNNAVNEFINDSNANNDTDEYDEYDEYDDYDDDIYEHFDEQSSTGRSPDDTEEEPIILCYEEDGTPIYMFDGHNDGEQFNYDDYC